MDINTRFVHGSRAYDSVTGAISFPIYQSATFRHPGLYETTGYDYSRLQNPTREELEKTIALLENGKDGMAFSTGMAAITAILYLFSKGDHILVSDDLYGGTYRLFEELYRQYGVSFTYIDTTDTQNIRKNILENTKGVFIETPSNPMMKVTDIRAVIQISREKNLLLIVDNTFLTPYFQRPLELGADIVIHSGTKFLGGHNDTLAGLLVVGNMQIGERLRLIQKSTGAVLSPFDSWLILRGIKTLGVRLEKQQQNANEVARWLRNHPKVEQVYYAGMEDHSGYDISRSQASGFGSMISFLVRDSIYVEQILKKVKVILFAESLGGVESLITYPIVQTHSAIPEEIRNRLGVNERLLRLSVGIEAAKDIIEDLEQALEE